MLKRTLFISSPGHVNISKKQLVLTSKETGETKTAPVEDLGCLVLEHPQTTITLTALQELAAHNVGVIICDQRHMPTSMLLHLDTHYIQTERFRHQIEAGEPLRKQLWQQTIKSKLINQACLLDRVGGDGSALRHLATGVKSGDTDNREAQGARRYWAAMFDDGFRRERFGPPPNEKLNYGYSIIRAAMARALAGSGLLPTLGIFHKNKYNAFCLADDIMEPYRPFVDFAVWELVEANGLSDEVTQADKAKLVGLLARDVSMDGQSSTMMVAMATTAASLATAFSSDKRKLLYPEWP